MHGRWPGRTRTGAVSRVVLGGEKGEGGAWPVPLLRLPLSPPSLPPPSISPTQCDSNLTFIPWSFRRASPQ